eukprot:2534611-Pleurochrysis_carterae.AAC.1
MHKQLNAANAYTHRTFHRSIHRGRAKNILYIIDLLRTIQSRTSKVRSLLRPACECNMDTLVMRLCEFVDVSRLPQRG